jgi:plastocyanin
LSSWFRYCDPNRGKEETVAPRHARIRGKTSRFAKSAGALIALLALLLIASACDGGPFNMNDHHRRMHGGGGAPQAPVLSDQSEVDISMSDYDFSPRELTVPAGAAVTWTNRDSAVHDATDRQGEWATDLLGEDESQTVLFDRPGVFEYFCTVHPDMVGTLTVRTRE